MHGTVVSPSTSVGRSSRVAGDLRVFILSLSHTDRFCACIANAPHRRPSARPGLALEGTQVQDGAAQRGGREEHHKRSKRTERRRGTHTTQLTPCAQTDPKQSSHRAEFRYMTTQTSVKYYRYVESPHTVLTHYGNPTLRETYDLARSKHRVASLLVEHHTDGDLYNPLYARVVSPLHVL